MKICSFNIFSIQQTTNSLTKGNNVNYAARCWLTSLQNVDLIFLKDFVKAIGGDDLSLDPRQRKRNVENVEYWCPGKVRSFLIFSGNSNG